MQRFESIFDLSHPCIERFALPVTAVFDSFSSYCEKTGTPKALLCEAGTDGLTVRRDGQYVILYNDQVKNERRRAFTLAHEVGHILLSHAGEQPEVEEKEANAFAAALLCPAIAARYLAHRNASPLTEELLATHF
ncbi:MAG: ImmA/IrrE family metallo-endopeptidase [Clostridia bacterium]|nr:ImmA/IrrE family metallo-endopeptidase [Clostridia bacterium]